MVESRLETSILRVGSSAAFTLPQVRAFTIEALASNKLVRDPDAALTELGTLIDTDAVGTWIVFEQDAPVGLLVAYWNRSALGPGCGAQHFYNKGSPRSRAALVDALIAYAREGGFDTVLGFDGNNKPQAFARMFKKVGKPVFSGAIVAFRMRSST